MSNKYVVCKGYYGLGGNIAVLTCAMRVAEKLNRRLVVDWVESIGYGVKGQDIFQLLFENKEFCLEKGMFSSLRVWPDYWTNFVERTMPHSKEVVLHRVSSELLEEADLASIEECDVIVISRDDKYWHRHEYYAEMSSLINRLVPSERLRKKIEVFQSEKLGDNAIGVHFRHGNGEKTVVPPDVEWFFSAVDGFLVQSPSSNILVCTDCSAVEKAFVERYGSKVVFTEKEHPPLGSGPLFNINYSDAEKLANAEEALLDMWLLSKCSYIVGSKSFFSGVAIKLNGSFNRENEKTWIPKYREFKPAEGIVHVSAVPSINKMFVDEGLPTDGIYCEVGDADVALYYLYEFIYRGNDFDQLDWSVIKRKIKRYRLY